MAELCHHTSDQILDELKKMWEDKRYKALPQYYKGYLDATREMLYNKFWENLDDRWVIQGSTSPILTHDRIGTGKPILWSEVQYYGRFYKGTDKPYYYAAAFEPPK